MLDAARSVFAEDGLDAPITSIVARAGCAKGTFFRHFASKDELITALHVDRVTRLAAIATDVLENHPPGWPALSSMIERFNAILAPDRSVLQATAHQGRHAETFEATRSAFDHLDAQVAKVLHAAQAVGEVRADVAQTDIQVIAMAVTSATAPLNDEHPHLSRRYLRIMLDGLRAGPTTELGRPR